ncbi:flavin reductase family protein [Actinacidiphila oryziradicis]|uniref:Flavin reductase family protein n=1 Tax=Actinacidiphila oryziradicis TaxID=2571141 RepID=A0A4V5N1T9_9ACTN|nr:flavin reductase family protein [Actinacidiphila oryziradicis]TKA11209.1 flavin reductase family protein [Actinacidiphila oryziradicis]
MTSDVFALDSEVDGNHLRQVLGKFATGVAVVATSTARGPVGMTVNSFCSVSLSPPVVLFCVRHQSQLHEAFSSATTFSVNVLAEGQEALSQQFASPGFDRFGSVRWRPGVTRSPVLGGAHAVLECLTNGLFTAGDHDIVLGRVVAAHPLAPGQPLLFHSGGYRGLA